MPPKVILVQASERFSGNSAAYIVRNCEEPLRLGDIFTKAITWEPLPPHSVPHDAANCPSCTATDLEITSSKPVCLRVTAIEFYSHLVNYLDPVYIAKVTLSGEGFDQITIDGGLTGD